MAVFNPPIQQENDPNYLNMSRPISGMEGNKKWELGLKGAANLLEGGVRAADTIIKDSIDKQVYAEVDAERGAYTQALEDTTVPVGRVPGQPQRTMNARELESYTPLDLLPNNPQQLPSDLRGLPRTIGSLHGGFANGKISNTYYYGRLNSIAKDLRSRYPGYREYIDKQIAEVTGVNPANAYLGSLRDDLNQYLSKSRDSQDKTLAMIDKYIGIPGAPQIRQMYMQGQMDEQGVRQWVHNREVWDDFYKFQQARHTYNQNQRTEASHSAREMVSYKSSTEIAAHMDTMQVTLAGQKVNLLEYINQKPPNAEEARVIALELKSQREIMRRRLQNEFNKPLPNGRRAIDDAGGPDAVNKIIDEHLKTYDNFVDLMVNEQYGAAYQSAQRAKGLINDQTLRALQDKKIGPPLVMMNILKQNAGEPFVAQYYRNLLTNGFNADFKNYIEALEIPIMAQPTLGPNGTGTPITGNDQLTRANDTGIATPEMVKVIVDRLASIPNSDIPDPTKVKIARAAFSAGNANFISRINEDKVEIIDGRRVVTPGRIAVFEQLTSPEMTREMRRLGLKDPSLWNEYTTWVGNTFGNELFRREINNLKTYQRMPGVTITYRSSDAGAPQFGVIFQEDRAAGARPAGGGGPANPIMGMNPAAKAEIEASVAKLNRGLATTSQVFKEDNSNIEAYMLHLLSRTGVDFLGRGSGGQPIQGLPEDFRQAIINSRREPLPQPRPSGAGTGGPRSRRNAPTLFDQ